MKIRINLNIKVGRVVRFFILTDFLLLSGWGLVNPIFSVFVIQNIAEATLVTIGIGTAIYWLVKSAIQFPIAHFLDKTDGEKDDFYALVIGLILAGVAAFLFILVRQIWQLYLLQFLQAIAFGLYVPAWYAMFSRHLDKDNYALDWALDSGGVGLASGAAGLLGGILADALGFNSVFILAGVFSLIAALVVLSVPNLIFPPAITKEPTAIRDHKPTGAKQ